MAFGSKFSYASGTGNSNPNNWMIPNNSGGGGAGGGGSSGKGGTTVTYNPPTLTEESTGAVVNKGGKDIIIGDGGLIIPGNATTVPSFNDNPSGNNATSTGANAAGNSASGNGQTSGGNAGTSAGGGGNKSNTASAWDYATQWWNTTKQGVEDTVQKVGDSVKTWGNALKEGVENYLEEQKEKKQVEMQAKYPSLFTTSENDAMSGWRSWMQGVNNQYGGDIFGYANTDAFKSLTTEQKKQYYADLSLFNSLYSTVSGYDSEIAQKQKEAREAEEYANTRRMLMERYMPETLAAMGYANTGLAGDVAMKMNNAYDNYTINAKRASDAAQGDIMKEYQQAARDYYAKGNEEKMADMQATEEKTATQNRYYNTYKSAIQNGSNEYDIDSIHTAYATGYLTEEQYNELIEKHNEKIIEAQNRTAEAYKSAIDEGELIDFEMLAGDLDEGNISEDQYVEIRSYMREKLYKDIKAKLENDIRVDQDELQSYFENGYLSKPQYIELRYLNVSLTSSTATAGSGFGGGGGGAR